MAGDVLRRAAPERIDDVEGTLGVHDEVLGVVGAETAMLVPLIYRERPLGVLCVFDRMDDDPLFQDRDEQLLLAFAASAATAVATAKTVEADRLRHSLRSAERERSRWAPGARPGPGRLGQGGGQGQAARARAPGPGRRRRRRPCWRWRRRSPRSPRTRAAAARRGPGTAGRRPCGRTRTARRAGARDRSGARASPSRRRPRRAPRHARPASPRRRRSAPARRGAARRRPPRPPAGATSRASGRRAGPRPPRRQAGRPRAGGARRCAPARARSPLGDQLEHARESVSAPTARAIAVVASSPRFARSSSRRRSARSYRRAFSIAIAAQPASGDGRSSSARRSRRFLLGQVQVPPRLAADDDAGRRGSRHLRVPGREAVRARVRRDVGQPQRLGSSISRPSTPRPRGRSPIARCVSGSTPL